MAKDTARVNNLNNSNTEIKREELCRALLINETCNLFQSK